MWRARWFVVVAFAGCISQQSRADVVSEMHVDRGWLVVERCDLVVQADYWLLGRDPDPRISVSTQACRSQSLRLPDDLRGADATDQPPVTLVPHDAQAAVLLRRAQHAAKFGDCRSVRRFARDVVDLDDLYYRAVFAVEPSLAACLPPGGGAP